MAGTIEINNFPFNTERMKYASDGTDYPDIEINGSGFGAPPNIVLYRDWSRDPLGAVSLVNNMIGPDFSTNSGLHGNIIAAHGRNGFANREGGTDAATNNRKTSLRVVFPRPYKNYRVAHDLATPAGRTFSGMAAPGLLPSASVLKTLWLIDRSEGGPQDVYADMVVTTWPSASFALNGNTASYNLSGTSSYDFNDWNYFEGSALAGADPFNDNGHMEYVCSNALSNTTINTKTNVPAFSGGATAAQYDRLDIHAWSGNGTSHDLSLHTISNIYVAASDDDSVNQRILLTDNANIMLAKKRWLFPYKSWTGGKVVFSALPHLIALGFTHFHLYANGQLITGPYLSEGGIYNA